MKSFYSIQLIIIFFALGLFFAPTKSSSPYTDRSIASTTSIKEDMSELLDFKFLNATRNPKEVLAKLTQYYSASSQQAKVFIQVALRDASDELPDGLSYRLVPKIINEQYILEVQYTQKGLTDSAAAIEVDTFIKQFIKYHYKTKFHFYELYYNALNGDATSMHTMMEIKREAYVARAYIQDVSPSMKITSELEMSKIKKKVEKYAVLEKAQKTQKRLNRQKRLAQFTIDQKNLADIFKALVAKNDRQGTANLLEKILPWEIMQPLEKKMFKEHLTYMKNPLPLKKRILLYRGIDKNTIFLDSTNMKGAKVYDAIYSSQIFLLSHFLDTKKLTAKEFDNFHHSPFFLDLNSKKSNKFQRATPITSYFQAHSTDSFNSVFLSTSSDLGIAANFGRDRLAMLAIDPRMSYVNYASALKSEKEFLVPFFIFPDEILSTIQYSYDILYRDLGKDTNAEVQRRLLDAYYRKFSKSMDRLEADRLFIQIRANAKKYDNMYFDKNKSLMGPQFDSSMKSFIRSERKLFNTPLKPKMPQSCIDLMTVFNAILN